MDSLKRQNKILGLQLIDRAIKAVQLLLTLSILMLSVFFYSSNGKGETQTSNLDRTFWLALHGIAGTSMRERDTVLLFILDLSDFNCTPCLLDFLNFCDSLKMYSSVYGDRPIAFVFLRDTSVENRQRTLLEKWTNKLGISYPIFLVERPTLEKFHMFPSKVLMILNNDIVIDEHIPVSPIEKRNILKILFKQ